MSRKPKKHSEKSLERRKPKREPRKRLLIVCEGKKTEKIYFNYLRRIKRLPTVEVKVIGLGEQTINLVEHAIERLESKSSIFDDYDEVWCVSDVEVPNEDKSIPDALNLVNEYVIARKKKAKAKGKKKDNNGFVFEIILSNPSFEYWYILHYEKTHRAFNNNDQVERYLRKPEYFPDYDKAKVEICIDVYGKTDEAIKNAKELEQSVPWGEDLRDHNSSTHIYRVVESIIEISKM